MNITIEETGTMVLVVGMYFFREGKIVVEIL